MLKVVRVNLDYKDKVLDTYTILDDVCDRIILLPSVAWYFDIEDNLRISHAEQYQGMKHCIVLVYPIFPHQHIPRDVSASKTPL